MQTARDWDGRSYDRVSGPMERMGLAVLARLDLRGDEIVVDAGCGSGRITQALIERLPRGRAIGIDGSPSMIAAARDRLGPGADLRVQDLLALDLGGERADAIFSTATFHWIADHDALFARLRGALRDGGALVAQCGGAGNIANVHAAAGEAIAIEPFAQHFAGWRGPWNFATPEDTERRLRAAGFSAARAWLEPWPVTPEEPREYLRTVNLGAHLERLPEDLRASFVAAVLERLGEPVTIEYVRLNIDAIA
ncbi:MAG TPA: methyltransferase domain-containing protein [Solirubrobacteraceae bacterium]|nr:methyltransferase domain-containing protein [Solirubrobacteraceae bacterium]